jgi:hypothetical protein
MSNLGPAPAATKGKKLTAAQKKAQAAAKKGGYIDKNLDGIPDRDQLNFDVLGEQWAWVRALIEDDAEIARIFKKAADRGFWETPQGIANFQNDVRQSQWWQNSNSFFREAYKIERTDPGTFGELLRDARTRVEDLARSIGVNLPPTEVDSFARKYLYEGWGSRPDGETLFIRQIANRIEYQAGPSGVNRLRGQASQIESTLKNIALNNGLKFDDQYFLDEVRSILSGFKTPEEAERDLREQAASRWPVYGDRIRAGQDARVLASGYINMMAEELELDAASIQLSDPYIQEALGGQIGLGDFYQKVRQDPRWMNTRNAQNSIAGVASKVMEMFGLVG